MLEANHGCEWRGYFMGLVAEWTPTSGTICQEKLANLGDQMCLEAKINWLKKLPGLYLA